MRECADAHHAVLRINGNRPQGSSPVSMLALSSILCGLDIKVIAMYTQSVTAISHAYYEMYFGLLIEDNFGMVLTLFSGSI